MINTPSIKLLLVEDHKLMRVGLKSLFEEQEGLEVTSEAQNGKDAVEKFRTTHPDVTIMDIGLPDITGIEATKQILELNNNAKIIILTSHLSEEEVIDSLQSGARAYVMKDINTDTLKMIIQTIKDGAMWIDPLAVPILREKNNNLIPERQMSRAMFRQQHSNLTQREYEVLKLIVDGKSNNEIADELTISSHTAKAHVCNIIQKLLVDDRTQAAVKAIKEGLV
ncbi:response regulator transcription factor [bacterium]|nr:response regulator transcription factor [bacterium]